MNLLSQLCFDHLFFLGLLSLWLLCFLLVVFISAISLFPAALAAKSKSFVVLRHTCSFCVSLKTLLQFVNELNQALSCSVSGRLSRGDTPKWAKADWFMYCMYETIYYGGPKL